MILFSRNSYFGSDGGGHPGRVAIGSTTYFYNTVGNLNGTYSLTTDTTGASGTNADYAVFSGQTGSSFTLNQNIQNNNFGNSGVFGLQIVNTSPAGAPEPSQLAGLAFTGFGAMGLVLKARKRKTAPLRS